MLEFLFSLVVGTAELAFIKFGGLLVHAFTGGRWRAERLRSAEYRHKSSAGALTYKDRETTVVTPTGQLAAAMCFFALVGLAAYALYS